MNVNEAKWSGPLYESLTLILLFIVFLLLHELFESANFSLTIFDLLSAEIDKKDTKKCKVVDENKERYEEGKSMAAVGLSMRIRKGMKKEKVWQRWDSSPRHRNDWCLKPAP